jgi:hypothetical protein
VSRTQQQAVVNTFATPWLAHHLLGQGGAWNTFLDLVSQQTGVEATADCISTGVGVAPVDAWAGCATLAVEVLTAWTDRPVRTGWIVDGAGRKVAAVKPWQGNCSIPVSELVPGGYLLVLVDEDGVMVVHRFLRVEGGR